MVSGVLALLAGTRVDGADFASTAALADSDLMKRYLLRHVDQAEKRWEADYEARKTPEQIAAYQKQSRQQLLDAIAPSCYLNNLPATLRTAGAMDAEHHTWASMSVGPQQTDLLMLSAPVPILLCEGTKDYFPIEGSWQAFRYAKRLYTRLGFAERIDIIENDAPHNFERLLREGVARWMSRWLLREDRPITEPAIVLLTDREAQCTPDGQVLKLPGARSAYDLNDDYENELAQRRVVAWARNDWTALLGRVRQIAGIRPLEQLAQPQVERGETLDRPGYRIETLALQPEEGLVLPASLFLPKKAPSERVILYIHERGKEADAAPGGPIEQLVLGGARVLAVELRGTGQSQQSAQRIFGPLVGLDWRDVSTAYVLGRSFVGMRAEDVLVATRYAMQNLGDRPPAGVDLIAVGHVGVPALHAAATEPSLFRSVKLSQTLVSWGNVIRCHPTNNQYINVAHGALLEYDLPDLAAALGDYLTIDDARDGAGKAVASK